MPRVRLGVALLVPPPVAAEIDGLRRACGDGALGRIPPHVTLVPPVNVRDDRYLDAVDVLRAAAASTRPFTVRLGPPATFAPVTPVLHLPVHGDDVTALRDRVFRDPLERPLTHPFVPHVTLADEIAEERLAPAVAALADYRATVTFDRVHLMRERSDRVWEPVADAPFADPIVVGRGGLELRLEVTETLGPEAAGLGDREWPLLRPAGRRSPLVVTAWRDGEVVGVADGWTWDAVGFLDGLLVAAAHRGEGVGSHLLARFESECASRGATRLSLQTPDAAFYAARGWHEEGRLRDWLDGRDRLLLRKDLASPA